MAESAASIKASKDCIRQSCQFQASLHRILILPAIYAGTPLKAKCKRLGAQIQTKEIQFEEIKAEEFVTLPPIVNSLAMDITCQLCHRIVIEAEKTTCIHCLRIFHRPHFLEYVKGKGKCPVCQQAVHDF